MAFVLQLAPPSPAPSLRGVELRERVPVMVRWFRENFEDPHEATPPDTADEEYGWMFLWGGPFEAGRELKAAFPEAVRHEIDVVAQSLEEETFVTGWAPAQCRLLPAVPDRQPPRLATWRERSPALHAALGEIETYLARQRAWAVDDRYRYRVGPCLEEADLQAMEKTIDAVRRELDRANPLASADAVALDQAATHLDQMAGRVRRSIMAASPRGEAGYYDRAGDDSWVVAVQAFSALHGAVRILEVWADQPRGLVGIIR